MTSMKISNFFTPSPPVTYMITQLISTLVHFSTTPSPPQARTSLMEAPLHYRFQGDPGAQGVSVRAAPRADGPLPGERQRDARADRRARGRRRHVVQAGRSGGDRDERDILQHRKRARQCKYTTGLFIRSAYRLG